MSARTPEVITYAILSEGVMMCVLDQGVGLKKHYGMCLEQSTCLNEDTWDYQDLGAQWLNIATTSYRAIHPIIVILS